MSGWQDSNLRTLAPKASALDLAMQHPEIYAVREGLEPPIIPLQEDRVTACRINHSANAQFNFYFKELCGSGGIRTHSAEATVLQTVPALQRWRTPI
jgi:hypothetical protein